MMKLVGLKRVAVVAILLFLNLASLGLYYLALTPMHDNASRTLQSLGAQISELTRKIASTKQEMAYFKDNVGAYTALKDGGFFKEQDRFMIGRLIEDTGKKAALSGFTFRIDDLAEVKNDNLRDLDYKLVKSTITIASMNAALDRNITGFLQDIGTAFPKHTRINKFEIRRGAALDDQTLSQLASGRAAPLVTASVSFDWVTLAPKDASGDGSVPAASGAAVPAPAGGDTQNFRGR